VQIAVGAGDFDVLIDKPTQRGGNGRGLLVPHGGIAHQGQIKFELGGVVTHEFEQMLRAALLLTLDHGGNRQWQLAGNGLKRPAGLNEGHRLSFVVAGTARDDDFAPVSQRFDARFERRRVPEAEGINRLNVVMAIKKDARARNTVGFADYYRMTFSRAHIGGKSDAAQVGGDALGSGPALFLVRRVGGNGGNAQQRKQTVDALVDILVDAAQHRVECAHGGAPLGRICTLAMLSESEKRPPMSKTFEICAELQDEVRDSAAPMRFLEIFSEQSKKDNRPARLLPQLSCAHKDHQIFLPPPRNATSCDRLASRASHHISLDS